MFATINQPDERSLGGFEVYGDNEADETENKLLSYEPIIVNKYGTSSRSADNKIPSSSQTFSNLEKESPEVMASADADASGSPNSDTIKQIAFNSREVRLVGPDQKEVEMKDDVATKVAVALDNLQKEATEVWGQVNEKLDKGWTELRRSEVWGQVNDKLDKGWKDLKSMVEGVVAPSSKSSNQARREN